MVQIVISKPPTVTQLYWCENNIGPAIESTNSREVGKGWGFFRSGGFHSEWIAEFSDDETAMLFILSN